MRKIFFSSIIIGVVLLSSCFKDNESTVTGVLSGVVILDPMCANEPCDLGPKELEALWGPRKIVVYASDSLEVIQHIGISIDGKFSTGLPVGEYIIDINGYENDISPDVPTKVTIVNGLTAYRTILIATGL